MLNVSVVIKCTIYKFERVTRESRLVVASQGFKIQFPSFHVQYNLSISLLEIFRHNGSRRNMNLMITALRNKIFDSTFNSKHIRRKQNAKDMVVYALINKSHFTCDSHRNEYCMP